MRNRALRVASSIMMLLSTVPFHACNGGGKGAGTSPVAGTADPRQAETGGNGGGSTAGGAGGPSVVAESAVAAGSGGMAGSGGAAGSGGGGGSGGAQCGRLVWDPRPSCETCVEQNCCAELADCDSNGACSVYRACVDACGANPTVDCIIACDAMDGVSGGRARLHALTECYAQHCERQPECEYPICDSGLLFPDQGCASCLGSDASCCAAVTTCAGDPACAPCLAPTWDPSCATNAAFQKVQACESSTCAAACTFQLCGPAGGGYPEAACNDCVNRNCCAEYAACKADDLSFCAACAEGDVSEDCSLDPDFALYRQCVASSCSSVCGAVLASL